MFFGKQKFSKIGKVILSVVGIGLVFYLSFGFVYINVKLEKKVQEAKEQGLVYPYIPRWRCKCSPACRERCKLIEEMIEEKYGPFEYTNWALPYNDSTGRDPISVMIRPKKKSTPFWPF